MSDQDTQTSFVSRSQLAAQAAAQAERNKPKLVLVIGVLVLLAGVVYLLVGRSALGSALADRRREVGSYSTVQMQQVRLEQFIGGQTGGDDPYRKVPNFTSLAESAAKSVGLTPLPTLNSQQETREGDLTLRTYQYDRVISRDLEALLGWVAQVEKMVPGVEISRLELSPSRTQWQLSITFVKPELSS